MINCLIVDDNTMARMALRQMLAQIEQVQVVGECASAVEAYNVVGKQGVDLIFLDIEMPGMSGLEFARQPHAQQSLIIYTTGKAEYAVDAFALNVVDYLLKPIDTARLLSALSRAKEMLQTRQQKTAPPDTSFFFVKDKSTLRKVLMQEVSFFEAMGDYVKIYTTDKTYMVHTTLKSIESKLPADDFIRVHRSYIVALKRIEQVEDGVLSIGKHGIPVAEAYRSALNSRLNIL